MTTAHSELLQQHLEIVTELRQSGSVLDLACGRGRNGLYLLKNKLSVVFADRNPEALSYIEQQLQQAEFKAVKNLAQLWPVDFETQALNQLQENSFAAVIVYRYLHRPLMESLKKAILPGGLVVYETFTVDQPQFGRPKNPDFLLRKGELDECFSGWEILHRFEGKLENYTETKPAAIAQIVARKLH